MAPRDLLLVLATCGAASAARLKEMLPQQPAPIATGPVTWVDALTLGVGGRPFASNTGIFTYARMPPGAQPDLNPGEWFWSSTSSGMFVQFTSNASAVFLSYVVRDANLTSFSNFPPIGYSGMDLYRRDGGPGGAWRWVSSTFNGLSSAYNSGSTTVTESPLFVYADGWPVGPVPPEPTVNATFSYRLHLPVYNGVLQVQVGVPEGASLAADLSWNASGVAPVVYVGTSIAQGGVTPRPGDIFTNRLSRALPVPVTNLGFCGSCRLELGLAKWVSRVPASVIAVDCGANMDAATTRANTAPFVRALRSVVGAALPIVLVEPTDFRPGWLLGDVNNVTGVRAELCAAYEELVSGGDSALHYVPASDLWAGEDGPTEELTYEGVHPHDRGHELMAEALAKVLGPLVTAAAGGSAAPPRLNPCESGRRRMPALAAPPAARATAPADLPTPASEAPPPGTVWTDSTSLTMRGRAFNSTPTPWNRLPAAAHGVVRSDVWGLSLNSAGITVSFSTDSPFIAVDYTAVDAFEPMVHFPVTGVSGIDLYAWDDASAQYRFVAPSQIPYGNPRWTALMTPGNVNVSQIGGKPIRWLLYACTYNTVASLLIGTAPGAAIRADEPYTAPAPIVWYGTSILQGGVSFRPGRIFTARVGRALSTEVFNFGFSGNGKMELNVAQYLVTISPPPSVFIVDCSWNMNADSISAAAVPFVQYLRAHGLPNTPVVLAEGTPFGRNWAVPAANASQADANAALRAAYTTLVAAGDKHLFYVESASLFGPAATEDSGTANGLHSTDAGMHDVAAFWIKFLPTLTS